MTTSKDILRTAELLGHESGRKGRPVVSTSGGRVRGASAGGVYSFLGIPYGQPTGGLNRFRQALPAQWIGIRDALACGPRAPQADGTSVRESYLAWLTDTREQSEDCLVINVFSGSLTPSTKQPVLVFLHGGGFRQGTSSKPVYDGSSLASRGGVVVTLNSRLNIFGHLHLAGLDERYADSGNVGMLNIVAALRWVRENIANFGGDPDNVTVFGQSGGASKVGILMEMPEARNLFHKAIIQSASSLLRLATLEEADRNTDFLLKELGIDGSDLSKLVEISTADLLRAALQSVKASGGVYNFRPVVDGRTLPGQPFAGTTPRWSTSLPLMLGWCETEQRFQFARKPGEFALPLPDVRKRVAGFVGVEEPQAERLVDVYRGCRPGESPGDVMALIYGDHRYRRTVTRAAAAQAVTGASTYLYRLSWKTPVLDGILRSPHALCLPFVFANVDVAREFTGDGSDRYPLQAMMSDAWLEFARRGNPNHCGMPTWRSFTKAGHETMIFDSESRCEADPAGEERRALEECPPYFPAEAEGGKRQ